MRGALIAGLRGQRLNQGWYWFGLLESKSESEIGVSAGWQEQIGEQKDINQENAKGCYWIYLSLPGSSNSHMLTFH